MARGEDVSRQPSLATRPRQVHTRPRPRRVDAKRQLSLSSDRDPFDLVQFHLIAAPIVESRGSRRLVVGHLLGNLRLAAVAQLMSQEVV
jgi:hypothetical protein